MSLYNKAGYGKDLSLQGALEYILEDTDAYDNGLLEDMQEQIKNLQTVVIALAMCCAHRTDVATLLNAAAGFTDGTYTPWQQATIEEEKE